MHIHHLLPILFLLLWSAPAHAVGPGDRIKLACPPSTIGDHPCRAVYHWGIDGKRHAFPNEDTYKSWFADFVGVQTIDATSMANLMLGTNVGVRPGSRLVKFQTEPRTYAVDAGGVLRWVTSEDAARALYGTEWAKQVRELPDTSASSYTYGAPVNSTADFDPAARMAAAPTIDADTGATYALRSVATARGTFDAHVLVLERARWRMQTLAANSSDCSNGCAAKSLADHAKTVGASMGIHGSYFCPPDYADCAAKTNSFLSPMFDTVSGTMRMAGSIPFHNGPLVASSKNGEMHFFRRATDFGNPAYFESTHGSALDAAMANYPALVDGGAAVAESEPRLEDGMKTNKATRGGIGFSADKVFLVIAKGATVPDLAAVMVALGATNAMNLDGGGSSALLYGGTYKVGPWRALPNAIVFTAK